MLLTIRWSKACLLNWLPDKGRGSSFVCSVGAFHRGFGIKVTR